MLDRRNFMRGTAAGGAMLTLPFAARAVADEGAAALDDMAILRAALDLHPGLYRYNSPREIADGLLCLEVAQGRAATRAERFVNLQRFLSSIRCGHTQCNFYNQSDAVAAELFERPTRVPFAFVWLGDAMVVTRDLSGTGKLEPGTRIVTLNGVPVSDILYSLLPLTRADGHNDAKRRSQLEMRNTDTFEYFDVYQGLLFPPENALHRITAQRPDGSDFAIELPAIGLAERQAGLSVPDDEGTDTPLWTWEMRGDVAVLTMPTWVMYNTKWDWERWLDDRLASLSGARGLVLDLRDNEGGNECGNVILSRLTDRDIQFPGYRKLVRYREVPAALDPYLDTWDRSFRKIGVEAEDVGGGFYELPGKIEETDFIPAMAPRLTVPVAALISPVCSSATFSFARRAKESGLVRLFGETSGGNLRGINGGSYFFVRLPESGIEFDIPLIGYFPTVPQPDAGVDPDVVIPRSIADIAGGRDACMERAIDWLSRR
ncbi:S41 family peptidase [Porphyrobacter sp. YT40]|uniref:S41 family peptidase n=1 Tax=Porphyrobacter sp. YT40 TaxID=2547601 RepID=UPI0011436AA5|nr:S41 family peptidase [Porphyrobacter sp. YT40]QDH35050.1 peptidase S41 [Porphyrobacter sp. YT40]